MNVDTTINNLSLCSGGGGLDLGLELVLPGLRTVCWVEWEAFAIDYLATRMEEKCFHPAPIWSDLRTFDGQPWRGVVDCLTAGYPCQPFSTAGKRGGADDPRHLWPSVQRVIGETEPSIVFAENVSGHTSLGGEQVVADLQGMGYEVAAGLFTASEVGASHKRERFFILAVENACNIGSRSETRTTHVQNGYSADSRTSNVSNREKRATNQSNSKFTVAGTSRSFSLAETSPVTKERIWASRLFPPGPDAIDQWQSVPQHLWPALKPGVCGLVDGLAIDRTRYHKLLGNGVVPLQAAYAFVSLWSVIESRRQSG
jgi:DNA (cytosine-5)-methyltransferase 1